MSDRENARRSPGVTARKATKKRRDFVRHRGQWTHCYGRHCDGSRECKCEENGCYGCRMIRAECAKTTAGSG